MYNIINVFLNLQLKIVAKPSYASKHLTRQI